MLVCLSEQIVCTAERLNRTREHTMSDDTKTEDDKRRLPTHEEATERVLTRSAIDLSALAVLMDVHPSTLHRLATKDAKNDTNEFPVPFTRIGQRWVIPSEPVRAFLRLGEFSATAKVAV